MAEFRSRKVELPPYTFWEVRGGIGPPVVLLHGLSGSSRWWGRNVEALAARYTVSAIDLIGFGRNRKFLRRTPLPPSFRAIASLIIRWLDEGFEQPVHLAGHSMGGQIAIHIAAQRPDLVRSLVLVNAAGIPFTIDPRGHAGSLGRPPAGFLRFSRMVAGDFLRAGPTAVAVASARILLDDARDAMRSIAVPTLIVWGARDPLIPLRYGEEMQREIRGSQLVVLPDAAHVAMWESPASFNATVLNFFDTIEKTPSTRRAGPADALEWKIEARGSRTAFRRSGSHSIPNIILVHGLGMSSAYFEPLARALVMKGSVPLAPDLPGFGASADGPEDSPQDQASLLIEFAIRRGISSAIWLGHSTGAQVVSHLAEKAPSLVRATVYLSPIWNQWRHPVWHLVWGLLRDIPREHLSLLGHAVPDYLRAGVLRWVRNFRQFSADANRPPTLTLPHRIIAGDRDPLMNWEWLETIGGAAVIQVPGAHGVNDSSPVAIADLIAQWKREL